MDSGDKQIIVLQEKVPACPEEIRKARVLGKQKQHHEFSTEGNTLN